MSGSPASHCTAALGSVLHRDQGSERPGLGRLRNLEPKPPVQRYEQERRGDLIHINIKKLARFLKVGTASQAIASRSALLASNTTGSTWPSTTPHGWLTSRCCRMRSRRRRWAFCCGPWLGSMVRGSAAGGFSPITAAPTAPGLGEKPVQRLVSQQHAPGRTHQEPTAKPSGSSRP